MAIKFLNDVAVDSSVLYVDTANNRIGVNDSSPTATLDVVGTISSTSNITTNGSIRIDSTGTPVLILDTGGYYPGATIEVRKNNSNSPSMGGLYWYQNPGTESSQWITRLGNSPYTTSSIILPTTSSYHFVVTLAATERFRINSSTGNVGIGTSSPSEKLEVNGDVKADAFIGQRVIVNGNAYHGAANSVYALYTTAVGMTTSTSNNRHYPYAAIVMPFNGVVEKIIVKNVQYSSYTSGPSASGTAKIQLNQYDSTFAPMDYSSGDVSFTAAANVSMTFSPNQSYNEGTHFRVFFNSSAIWRYITYQIVLKQTS